MIRFKLLAALVIMILGCLFFANFGIKWVITAPQEELLENVQDRRSKAAVEHYIEQTNRQKNRYMQQLIVVSIVGLGLVMVVFNTSIFNRVNGLYLRLKDVHDGKESDFPVQSGKDEISLLSNEIGGLITRNNELQQELKFSEECFRSHLSDHSELVCRLSPNGALTFVNDCFCDFFGKKPEELIDTKMLDLIDEDHRESLQKQLDALTVQQGTVCDVRVADKDGEPRRISWSWQLVTTGSRKETVMQGTGRDITREWTASQGKGRQRKLETLLLDISGYRACVVRFVGVRIR